MRRVPRSRLKKIEADLRLDPARCKVCRGVLPGFDTTSYVNPETSQEYLEPELPPPCAGCGKRGLVIVLGCSLPFLKPPGAPRASGRDMTEIEAADFWDANGKPQLAEWFRDRAAGAHGPPRVHRTPEENNRI